MLEIQKSKTLGIIGLLTTIAGVLTSPLLLDLLPTLWSVAVAALGAFIQAVTKAIVGDK